MKPVMRKELAASAPSRALRTARAFAAAAGAPGAKPLLQTLREQVRTRDYEGYLCGNFMPSKTVEAYYLTRAVYHEVAGAKDGARGNPHTARVRLTFWNDFIKKAYSGGTNNHPYFASFQAMVKEFGLTQRWFERIVEARDAEIDAPPPATLAEVEAFGEATSGSLGLLALELCGCGGAFNRSGASDSQLDAAELAALHIGAGLGLSNVIRNLPVDLRAGERRIPDDVLAACGLQAEDMLVSPEEVVHLASGLSLPEAAEQGLLGGSGGKEGSSGGGHGHSHGDGHTCNHSHGAAPAAATIGAPPAAAAAPVSFRIGRQDVGAAHAGPSKGSTSAASGLKLKPPSTGFAASASMAAAAPPAPTSQQAAPAQPVSAAPSASTPRASASSSSSPQSVLVSLQELRVVKPPAVMAGYRKAARTLAEAASARLAAARALQPSVPHAASAALLPAVPLERFLARLSALDHDVLGQGIGPWRDQRALARVSLLLSLLGHTLRGTY